MSLNFSRNLNALAALLLCGVLLGALGIQFIGRELPCPLGLLQRYAMIGLALGALLNVRLGPSPLAYGICLLSAVFGAVVAGRQMLLHIVPGDPGYGSPVWGLHLYSWALVVFVVAFTGVGLMLLAEGQFRDPPRIRRLTRFHRLALGAVLLVALTNAVATFFECGTGICPADPTDYQLLEGPGAASGPPSQP